MGMSLATALSDANRNSWHLKAFGAIISIYFSTD
jgi:hypothetical protein